MINRELFKAAIARMESDGGRNNWPRVEVSYMPAGAHLTVQGRVLVGTGKNVSPVAMTRWKKYGAWSAASYSRWQILYHTAADLGYAGDPRALWDDAVAEPFVDRWLDRHLGGTYEPTVAQLADAWNSGNWKDGVVPEQYIKKVEEYYAALGGAV